MLRTLRTSGSSCRAVVTASRSVGLRSFTLTLAYSGFESREAVMSGRPWAACAALNLVSASSRDTNSTDATSGIAPTDATSVSTWSGVALFWM